MKAAPASADDPEAGLPLELGHDPGDRFRGLPLDRVELVPALFTGEPAAGRFAEPGPAGDPDRPGPEGDPVMLVIVPAAVRARGDDAERDPGVQAQLAGPRRADDIFRDDDGVDIGDGYGRFDDGRLDDDRAGADGDELAVDPPSIEEPDLDVDPSPPREGLAWPQDQENDEPGDEAMASSLPAFPRIS
jgi:hypothetical protein